LLDDHAEKSPDSKASAKIRSEPSEVDVGVKALVEVGGALGVLVALAIGVGEEVGVCVAVDEAVGVKVGVRDGPGVFVPVAVGVLVGVLVEIGGRTEAITWIASTSFAESPQVLPSKNRVGE
jgi:hypothetical protein